MTPEKIVEQERIYYAEVVKDLYNKKAGLDFMLVSEAREKGLIPKEPEAGDEGLYFFGFNVKSRDEHFETSCLIKTESIEHNYIFKVFCRMEQAINKAIVSYFCNE